MRGVDRRDRHFVVRFEHVLCKHVCAVASSHACVGGSEQLQGSLPRVHRRRRDAPTRWASHRTKACGLTSKRRSKNSSTSCATRRRICDVWKLSGTKSTPKVRPGRCGVESTTPKEYKRGETANHVHAKPSKHVMRTCVGTGESTCVEHGEMQETTERWKGKTVADAYVHAVRMLKEELQLLQEPGSYVGEVVKVMGKNKVLVKVRTRETKQNAPMNLLRGALNEADEAMHRSPISHRSTRKGSTSSMWTRTSTSPKCSRPFASLFETTVTRCTSSYPAR